MKRRRIRAHAGALMSAIAVILTMTGIVACEQAESVPQAITVCDTRQGELIITEMLINPIGEDAGLEYIEIMNVSGRPLLVEGMIVISGSDTRPKISSVNGWTRPDIQPGERMVVSETPPGQPDRSISVDSLILPNSAGSVSLMCGTVQIEKVKWGDEIEAPPEGVALQRYRPSDARPADDNDTAATDVEPDEDRPAPADVWCPSKDTPDEDGNAGSPGKPNHTCETGRSCLEAVDSEDNASPGEGTGPVRSRPIIRPGFNDIVLTEVFSNPKGSDRFEEEWVEILALADFDLAGITITQFNGPDNDSASRVFAIAAEDCQPVKAGDIVVIGRGGNEGATPLAGNQTLYNATSGSAMFEFKDGGGNVIATARHPKVPDGASVALKATIVSVPAKAATADDDTASWIVTTCRSGQPSTPGFIADRCQKKGRTK